jgi:excisionase family DNA binding protein
MKEVEHLYTTTEAAKMLEVTASRVRQMVLEGTIRAEKKGRDLLIPKSQIEKAKARKTRPGPKKAGAKKSSKKWGAK